MATAGFEQQAPAAEYKYNNINTKIHMKNTNTMKQLQQKIYGN